MVHFLPQDDKRVVWSSWQGHSKAVASLLHARSMGLYPNGEAAEGMYTGFKHGLGGYGGGSFIFYTLKALSHNHVWGGSNSFFLPRHGEVKDALCARGNYFDWSK
jgi:hypothetical protein